MPNVVITSTTNSIKVDFGDYASYVGYSQGAWNKSAISSIKKMDGGRIEVFTNSGDKWTVSWASGSNFLIIDSIGGVAPTSEADLYTKLIALIA